MSEETVQDALSIARIQPAYRQVADQLRALILRGELGPGSRLPTETELTSMFGVSRSTVREALRVLSSQKLITTKRGVGGGTFIVRPEPEYISDFLETSLALLADHAVSVDTLLELRSVLEVPAAEFAAVRRTDEDLRILRETLTHATPPGADGNRFEEHRRFHQTILRATGNELLEVVAVPVFTTLRTRFLRDAAPPTFWQQVDADHDQIYAAIEAGNPATAREAMQAHLAALRGTYARIDREAKDAQ